MTNEEAMQWISELIKTMHEETRGLFSDPEYRDEVYEALDMAIKALEQEPILDKIRAEIEQTVSRYSISRERGGMGQVEWSDRLIKESEVLQIIDKYKADRSVEDENHT